MSATAVLTLADAFEMIDDLRHQVRELREDLATEVRTRRVVVVDENGGEHVHLWADENQAGMNVRASADRFGGTMAEVEILAGPTNCAGSTDWAVVSVQIGDGEATIVQAVEELDDGTCAIASFSVDRREVVES